MTLPLFILISIIALLIFEEFGALIIFGMFLLFSDDLFGPDENDKVTTPDPIIQPAPKVIKKLPHLDAMTEFDSESKCDPYYSLVIDQNGNKMCISVANY